MRNNLWVPRDHSNLHQITVMQRLSIMCLFGLLGFLPPRGSADEAPKHPLVSKSEEDILGHLPHWRFTTDAYKREALRLLIQEANSVARDLRLDESLPITTNSLTEIYIGP